MAKHMLSPRLHKLAELAKGTAVLWDVGSDHGKLPAWLLMNNYIGFAIASDIRQGPLDSALRTAKACKVDNKMKFILCDGLNAPSDETADTLVIAGMGGETIAAILEPAEWVRQRSARLLLQPMSSAEDLRAFLYGGGYTINAEYLVPEANKLYLVIDAVGGGSAERFDLADTRIGRHLADDAHFRSYADNEIKRLRREQQGKAAIAKRLAEGVDSAEHSDQVAAATESVVSFEEAIIKIENAIWGAKNENRT